MDNMTRKQIKIFSAIFTCLIVIIATISLYRSQQFRLTSIAPGINKTIPTSTNGFKLIFNKPLLEKQDILKTNPGIDAYVKSIDIKDNSLVLRNVSLKKDVSYDFKIKVQSKDGKITSVRMKFKTKYVPYNQISKDDKKLIEELASSVITKETPLLKKLPHSTLEYRIYSLSGEQTESGSLGIKPTIMIEVVLSGSDVKINRGKAIEKYKQNALDYIKSIGDSPESYDIQYKTIELE